MQEKNKIFSKLLGAGRRNLAIVLNFRTGAGRTLYRMYKKRDLCAADKQEKGKNRLQLFLFRGRM